MAIAVPHQTFRDQIYEMDPQELIERQLKDRNALFSLEERIALLVGCIALGEEQVAKVEKERADHLIVFLGNTGSGKSTFINYLAGCEMTIQERAVSDVIIVKESSPQKEVVEIGHTKVSKTFIPDVSLVQGRAYCDCPGFLDNRGVEINVANIVNTRRMLLASKRVRVVVLINYYSLAADRAKGLQATIDVAKQLFGSEQVLQAHQDSILLGITQVPLRGERQPQAHPIESLKEWICSEEGLSQPLPAFENGVLATFAERLFIYDPLDRVGELRWSGGVEREDLLTIIDLTEHITSPENVFNLVLTPEDEVGLREICEGMAQKIEESLTQRLYEDANLLLEYTYQIRKVDHPVVFGFTEMCKQTIITHFKGLIQEIDRELALHTSSLSPYAQQLFDIITDGIGSFRAEDISYLEQHIGLNDLKRRHATHKRKIQFFELENRLKTLGREFEEKCYAYDFVSAQELLDQIKGQVADVNERFKKDTLSSAVDPSDLEALLLRFQSIKENLDEKKAALDKEKRDSEAMLNTLQQAQGADRKQHEDALRQIQQAINSLRQQVAILERQRQQRLEQQRRDQQRRAEEESRRKGGGCIVQ